MSVESESFAYGSSMYGGRPTFALTRRLGDNSGLTLYEFIPEELADGRQRRFRRANSSRTLTRVPLTEALVDVQQDPDGEPTFGEVDLSSEHSLKNWGWSDWCALEVTTLRNNRQQAIQTLVKSILTQSGINPTRVTRGEGSALFSEGDGIRLTIAFLAMKHLQKYEKLTAVADSIEQMSTEECYYWHAKCRSPSSPHGVKALRVLLAGK